jgi:methylated-DNA-[protein]-cysteine S-methyltransferase
VAGKAQKLGGTLLIWQPLPLSVLLQRLGLAAVWDLLGNPSREKIRLGASDFSNMVPPMTEVLLLSIDQVVTPIGTMMIVADREGKLRVALFAEDEDVVRRQLRLHYGNSEFTLETTHNPHGLSEAITRYFAGELTVIDALPVETRGTPFQRDVWHALRRIPCGTTTSYGQLAESIGRSSAVRAVG